MNQTVTVKGTLLILRVVFVALVASVLIYLLVGQLVIEPELPPQDSRQFLLPFAVVAIACGVAAPFARRALLPPREPLRRGPNTTPEDMPSKVGGKLIAACVVGWALAEAVTIFGLVLGFLTKSQPIMYPFAAGSLLVFALLAPRRDLVESVARAAR